MSKMRNGGLAAAILAAAALATPMVVQWEGWETKSYADIADVWTICAGSTRGVKPNQSASDQQCETRTAMDIVEHGAAIAPCLPAQMPAETRAAFVVTAYNIGVQGFCGSSMSRKALAGDLRGACDSLMAWNKAHVNGQLVPVKGLTNRRTDERKLCLEGLQ